jgi:hypothetical protein
VIDVKHVIEGEAEIEIIPDELPIDDVVEEEAEEVIQSKTKIE